MHQMRLLGWRKCLSKSIFLCVLVTGLSACGLQGVKVGPEDHSRQPSQVTQMQETIGQQANRIMALELRLLAKQSEIKRLSSAQEQAIQEVVRVKAKLRSRNSKAETVANLAEVKLAMQGLQAKNSGDLQVKALKRAQQYVAMSEIALQEGNYDGASYLIGQAKSSFRSAIASPYERSEGNSNTNSFSMPVRMMVRQRCNVRAGPGLERKVLSQLNSGTSVLATEYRGLWVRIRINDELSGWIHYSLLKANL